MLWLIIFTHWGLYESEDVIHWYPYIPCPTCNRNYCNKNCFRMGLLQNKEGWDGNLWDGLMSNKICYTKGELQSFAQTTGSAIIRFIKLHAHFVKFNQPDGMYWYKIGNEHQQSYNYCLISQRTNNKNFVTINEQRVALCKLVANCNSIPIQC